MYLLIQQFEPTSVFVYCLKKEYISETCNSKKAVLILILLQLNSQRIWNIKLNIVYKAL